MERQRDGETEREREREGDRTGQIYVDCEFSLAKGFPDMS